MRGERGHLKDVCLRPRRTGRRFAVQQDTRVPASVSKQTPAEPLSSSPLPPPRCWPLGGPRARPNPRESRAPPVHQEQLPPPAESSVGRPASRRAAKRAPRTLAPLGERPGGERGQRRYRDTHPWKPPAAAAGDVESSPVCGAGINRALPLCTYCVNSPGPPVCRGNLMYVCTHRAAEARTMYMIHK